MCRIENFRQKALEISEGTNVYKETVISTSTTGVKITSTIFGALHSGLIIAADAVASAEASIVSRLDKRKEVTYEIHKGYRQLRSEQITLETKAKIIEAYKKSKASTKIVQLKTA